QNRPTQKQHATTDEIRTDRTSQNLDVHSERKVTGKEGRDCDKRRGRIPRARWLEWTYFLQDGKRFKTRAEIASSLKEKGLNKNRPVITYCHRGARAAAAYYALRSIGYENVKNYIGSWHEWSARRNLPVEK